MQKILHLNAGNETGGGMHHILGLLTQFNSNRFVLGVLEKGEMLKRANKLGIETVYFPHHMKMSIPLLRKISNYIKHKKVVIVHTHGPRANVYVNLLKKITNFHWIVTVHSDPRHDFMGKGMYGHLLSKLNVNAIKNADKIIAISEPFKQQLENIGVEPHKIITAFNGIDFQKQINNPYTKGDFGLSTDDFLFLMVARLEHVKGHAIALEAFANMSKKAKNCHLMLIGDGSLTNELKNQASDLRILENVHFLGYRDDVDRFYNMADITLLTSYSESFPLVLLESARAKTPVITTDVGGVAELIPDQSLGWRIQPGDVSELISAMEQALFFKEKNMLHDMGDKLFTHASTHFSLEIFANNIYNVYLNIDHVM